MKGIKTVLAGVVASVAVCLMLVSGQQTASALSCPSGTPGEGKDVSNLAECSISENKDTLMGTVGNIINFALGVLGIVAVAFIIMGGVTYITSNGDAAKLTKAKNTIIYAVIGLVVALLAFAIVNFVISNVFNNSSSSSTTSTNTSSGTK